MRTREGHIHNEISKPELPNFESLLKSYGITVERSLVVKATTACMQATPVPGAADEVTVL